MGTKAKTVIRSVLIGVLMVLVVLMMLEINRLQTKSINPSFSPIT